MCRVCVRLLCIVFVASGLLGAQPALAVDKEFIGTDNDWFNDDNWNPVELPGPDDEVMIGNGNTVTISGDAGEIGIFRIGGDIQLDDDGNPILRQDDQGPQGDKRLVTPSEGTLNITEGARLEVGVRGYAGGGGLVGGVTTLVGVGPSLGVINMSGGELIFSGPDPVLFLAADLENVGVLNISDGRIETDKIWISRAGHGTINQSGGHITIERELWIDEACGVCGVEVSGDTSGKYNLSGGELVVNGNVDIGKIGRPSSAVMNVSGGVATINQLRFPTTNETDQFNMSKVGVLRVTGQVLDINEGGVIDVETAVELGRISGLNLQVEEQDGVTVIHNPGDPNANGIADASDIDALSAVVGNGSDDLNFDLTDDDLVNDDDRAEWVTNVAMTFFGDTDLNRKVEFADFVTLSNNFNTEGGWSAGDSDGDGTIAFADFVMLSNNFGKTADVGVHAVPEPSGLAIMTVGVLLCIFLRKTAAVTGVVDPSFS